MDFVLLYKQAIEAKCGYFFAVKITFSRCSYTFLSHAFSASSG